MKHQLDAPIFLALTYMLDNDLPLSSNSIIFSTLRHKDFSKWLKLLLLVTNL